MNGGRCLRPEGQKQGRGSITEWPKAAEMLLGLPLYLVRAGESELVNIHTQSPQP